MVFVAELHGLRPGDPHLSEIRRSIHRRGCGDQRRHQREPAENADSRNRVRAPMEDLSHRCSFKVSLVERTLKLKSWVRGWTHDSAPPPPFNEAHFQRRGK